MSSTGPTGTSFVALMATGSGGLSFIWQTAGGQTQGIQLRRAGSPLYLKLVASGGTYSGYYSTDGANYTLLQNGREIAGGGFGGFGEPLRIRVSPKPAVVSFTLRAQQPSPLSVLSPATTTTWVMHTAPAPHAVVPLNWRCLSGPNFFITQLCKVLPMLTLNYQVRGLGLDDGNSYVLKSFGKNGSDSTDASGVIDASQ